jgi:hypothetical protein
MKGLLAVILSDMQKDPAGINFMILLTEQFSR